MPHPFHWPWRISAVWVVLPIVGALVAATLEPIPPHDYWWHLVMGRLIAATGSVPDANLFLYTLSADAPFIDQPWLGQWIMWQAFDSLGHSGSILLRNVLLVASFALIVATAWRRSQDARAAGALGLLAAILCYPVLTVRTRMFAFLPFAAIVWVTFGVADGRLSRRWLLLAPVATVFWANTHGSFVLAPAIVVGVGSGLVLERFLREKELAWRELRDWAIATLLVVLAGGLGPHGLAVYGYVFQLAVESSVATSVSEWLPPNPEEPIGAIFLAAVVGSIVLLGIRRKRVRLHEVFVFAGMLYLSAGAIRSLFWWAAILPVILAPHLSALLPDPHEDESSRAQGMVHAAVVALLIAGALAVQPGVARDALGAATDSGLARKSGGGAWLLNHENAELAITRIREDERGRVFHDQALGGMLEFYLTDAEPAQVAFVDQRMEFVPESVWEQYFAVSRAENWEEELWRWEVDTLLLSHESQWPLIQRAIASPAWELVLTDASHLLFYRRSFDGAQHPPKEQ